MNDRDTVVTVDVREDIRAGREPFSRIMQAVGQLRERQKLRLLAPFEPVPLYAVLGSQGFSHESRPSSDGDWEVIFFRGSGSTLHPEPPAQPGTEARVELDVRGLEPPQPLVAILEAVEQLAPGATLRARTERRPMHLYPMLEERGLSGVTQELPDGSHLTDIRHR